MPLNWMTPERAREVRAQVFGDPDGGDEIVVSPGLAQAIREHRRKKSAEVSLSSQDSATAEVGEPDGGGPRGVRATN